MRRSFFILFSAMLTVSFLAVRAQENSPAKKPVPLSPSARLAAAKTAFLKSGGGSDIPYNVISSALEGWPRFALVDSPEKADLIIEISSPTEDNGVSVSSSTRTNVMGKPESSTTTTRELSVSQIKMVVYDAKNKVALWSATEQPKSAFRQKAREDNLVEAAQRLFTKFRDRIQPPEKPAP